jgi:hypothetical protein
LPSYFPDAPPGIGHICLKKRMYGIHAPRQPQPIDDRLPEPRERHYFIVRVFSFHGLFSKIRTYLASQYNTNPNFTRNHSEESCKK